MSVENPLRWLLRELPDFVPAHLLPILMEHYELNKAAYYRECKIRHAERIIRSYQRRNSPHEAANLARWQAKLERLKEQNV